MRESASRASNSSTLKRPSSVMRPPTQFGALRAAFQGVVHKARILGNTDEPIPAAHEGGVQVSRAN
ncbi:MAG: hypothetical protein VB141_07140, partial [Burkholderia gladioli]